MYKIKKADLNNFKDQESIFNLLNVYIDDQMGSGVKLNIDDKIKLINGLREVPNTLIYFALYENQYIGMAISYILFSTFLVKKLLNIHDIIVMPKHRNRGVGRMLLNELENEARRLGSGKMTLEVRHDNDNAIHLYKKFGFKDCDPRMHFWVKKL